MQASAPNENTQKAVDRYRAVLFEKGDKPDDRFLLLASKFLPPKPRNMISHMAKMASDLTKTIEGQ